jgi:ribose-phosphate pyrophosphokinase
MRRRRRRSLVHHRRLLLVAGSSHPELAERIAATLGTSLGAIELSVFANGESYCRFRESVRGADTFLIQSCSPPVNDRLVELLLMVQAARLASAHRITAVMPWFPYSRQDKKSAPREPISARLVADLLEAAGVDRVLTTDLHAGQIQGFFTVPVDHMTALPLFADHFRALASAGARLVAVAPDFGRAQMARRISRAIGADFAIVAKTRPRHDVADAADVIGDVRGKIALLGDDMIVTGGTLAAAAGALRLAGADEVRAFATHALFADDALHRLAAAELAELVVTDTVPIPASRPLDLTVLSVAGLLAETIDNAFAERSVSGIFRGTELF